VKEELTTKAPAKNDDEVPTKQQASWKQTPRQEISQENQRRRRRKKGEGERERGTQPRDAALHTLTLTDRSN
jgi:hypothetical protein